MRDRLIGTWKLVSAVREEMSSARVDQLGANAHRIGPYLKTRKNRTVGRTNATSHSWVLWEF
jgi:hypothetical protein